MGIARAEYEDKQHRKISLPKEEELETNTIPTHLASAV